MAGWLKTALMSLFLDKKARRKADRKARLKEATKAPPPKKHAMTPEREKLIREAQEVMRSKADVLDNLSPQARAKLIAMAFTASSAGDEDDKT